jgi:hypothetical protein
MQYFKPAAGIIIFIFVLAVIYGSIQDKRNNERIEAQRQVEAKELADYNSCIGLADSELSFNQILAEGLVTAARESGLHDDLYQRCMNRKLFVDGSYDGITSDRGLALAAERNMEICDLESVEEIKDKSAPYGSFTNNSLNSAYEAEVSACKNKYGR